MLQQLLPRFQPGVHNQAPTGVTNPRKIWRRGNGRVIKNPAAFVARPVPVPIPADWDFTRIYESAGEGPAEAARP